MKQKLKKMKTIITISALMLTFALAKADSLNLPADQPQATSSSERSNSAYMLDSLQSTSEKTPFKGFNYLDERVQQKLLDMQVADCSSRN